MSISTNIKGFLNIGNTCYMNSTLQALLSSNILNTILIYFIKKNPETLNNLSPILIEYCKIIIDLTHNNIEKRIYSPRNFKIQLDKENSWFRGFRQHDANEFMLYLINEFADEKKNEKLSNLVKNICFGKYKQFIECSECHKITINYFNFLDIQLPIPNINNPDLEQCFKKFAENNKLDNDNKFLCTECKKKVIAYKRMEIEEVPDVAIFTFKRFKGTSKNTVPIIIYPNIELEGKKLKLISTINHYGGTHGGHYMAHISRNNKWYKANDSNITEINPSNLMNDKSVYMVIYQVEV